jgi:hypothetical protein
MKEISLAYADADRKRAQAVRNHLVRNGLALWDDSKLEAGVDWRLSILDRLREAAAIVVLASPEARASTWVNREVDYARTSGTPIVPLLLDGDPLPQLADIQHARVAPDGSVPKQVLQFLQEAVREDPAPESDAARSLLRSVSDRSISRVLNEVQHKFVLLLGNFSEASIDRLAQLQASLERHSFQPVIFDFDRPQNADYGETIRLLAGLAGFVIADMSDARSVAMELQLIAPQLAVPIVPIIVEGQSPPALFGDFVGKYDWVLPVISYKSIESLVSQLDEIVIKPARRKRDELRERKKTSRQPRQI